MARLFGKEYHKISNTWYFKDMILILSKDELLYQLYKNEQGNVIFRFFAISHKKKHFPHDLFIVYDPDTCEVIEFNCNSCLKQTAENIEIGCSHYISVINYCFQYLSSDIINYAHTTLYTNNLLVYNELWQSGSINGKIYIENIYNKDNSTIRFYFNDYQDINLYYIALLLSGRELPVNMKNKHSLITKQMSSLTDLELSLLKILQSVKCAHSIKLRYWTIYKRDFVKTFPFLIGLSLSQKVLIRETKEKLDFNDEKYNLSLVVSKNDSYNFIDQSLINSGNNQVNYFSANKDHDSDKFNTDIVSGNTQASITGSCFKDYQYVIKSATRCFFSSFFVGNLTYLFVENKVYSLRLPFPKPIIEQIFSGGFYCSQNDLIYLATVVTKQLSTTGYYIDFDEDIKLPEHFINRPQVIFYLRKPSDTELHVRCVLDYKKEKLSLEEIMLDSNLVAIDKDDYQKVWFYLPFDIRNQISEFFNKLPLPDEAGAKYQSVRVYKSIDKIDSLKKAFYENIRNDWIVDLDDQLKNEFIYQTELNPLITIKPSDYSDTNNYESLEWFNYDIEYKVFNVTYTHEEMKGFFRSNEKYMKLPDGKLVYFPNKDTFEEIDSQVSRLQIYDNKKLNKLSYYNLSYLYILAQNHERISIEGNKYIEKMYESLLRRKSETVKEVPITLHNVMRGYQKAGFRWLEMLQRYHLNGILADDMGLGKTLQTISILVDYYYNYHQNNISNNSQSDTKAISCPTRYSSLVICPKTLLYNWATEIEKFHANLTYVIYEGHRQDREAILDGVALDDNDPNGKRQVNIIIVSYSLIHSDIDIFTKYKFGYVILDEAQHIKNPLSLRSKAVKKLNSQYKLALTGTPLENNIIELWSIFDFLLPGYLDTLRNFKKNFGGLARDINSRANINNNAKILTERQPVSLQKLISPFLLRRNKTDVLMELPDKQEQILFCRMSSQQEKMYLKIIAMVKRNLLSLNHEGKKPFEKHLYFNVLAALTRLRQICNHPGILKNELLGKSKVSGKLELICELIQEGVDNGRNILVFSQFATMLRIIAKLLIDIHIPFEHMDGNSSNRQEIIGNFLNNQKIQVFLLTLKVGGLGLNLTKADTVILVDPWWNPMAEDQSIDRAHRIGQKNKVMVYKTITKGTVEEKILQLQTRKRDLFNHVIENNQEIINRLTIEEIKDLFEYNRK